MKIFVIFLAMLSGCSIATGKDPFANRGFDLAITNKSNIDIFPKLSTFGNHQIEDFGVVSIESTAVKGFGSFKLAEKITITWEEGEPEIDYQAEVSITDITPFDEQVRMIEFLYIGDKVWYVRGLDKRRNEIVKSQPSVLLVDGEYLD
jgi:hypothetical protein